MSYENFSLEQLKTELHMTIEELDKTKLNIFTYNPEIKKLTKKLDILKQYIAEKEKEKEEEE